MRSAGSLREPHHLLPHRTDTVVGTRELAATRRRRMLDHQSDALAHLGRTLPGPLPAGEIEPEPGGGVTEHSR